MKGSEAGRKIGAQRARLTATFPSLHSISNVIQSPIKTLCLFQISFIKKIKPPKQRLCKLSGTPEKQ